MHDAVSSTLVASMNPNRKVVTAKNLLVGGGAYYLSWWIAYPLAFGYGKLTGWITYPGDFAGAVVLPLVTGLPYAFVAFGVGALVACLVESEHPLNWVVFPSILYALYSLRGHHWGRPPTFIDRTEQLTGALFLAVACLGGAALAVRYRGSLLGSPSS